MFVNKKKSGYIIFLILAVVFVLAACNKPTGTADLPAADDQGEEPAPPPQQDDQPDEQEEAAPPEPDLFDAALFIEHTTIPTGTVIGPSLVFTKTWEVANNGTTVWDPDYALVFHAGEQLEGPDEQPAFEYYLPESSQVSPGETVTVTVMLTSPPEEGQYLGYWMLRNPESETFGIGEDAEDPLLVDIIVKQGAGLPGFDLGDVGDVGAGADEINGVQDVTLDVTPSEYSGDCPVQLVFSGAVETTGTGPFSYEYVYDVNTDLPGWELLVPPPQTFNYDSPGWHIIQTNFEVMIPADADGWIRLDSNGPDSSSFSEVYYNVDCNE